MTHPLLTNRSAFFLVALLVTGAAVAAAGPNEEDDSSSSGTCSSPEDPRCSPAGPSPHDGDDTMADGHEHDNEDDDGDDYRPSLNVVPVPRLSARDVSVDDFRAAHLSPPGGALPLVIADLRGVDPSDWTRARLRELCGDAPLLDLNNDDCDEDDTDDEDCHSVNVVQRGADEENEWGGLETADLDEWDITTWGDLMDRQEAEDGGGLYLHDASVMETCPWALDKLPGMPKYFQRDYDIFEGLDGDPDLAKVDANDEDFWDNFETTLHFPSIFVGKGGSSGSRLHADVGLTRAFMLHLSGRKVWRLAAPKDRDRLYSPSPRALFGTQESCVYTVDLFDPDFEAHPLMDGLTVYEVVAEPGQIVFFPEGWPHQVRNLDDTVAVSVNFVDNGNLADVAEHNRQDRRGGGFDAGDEYLEGLEASFFMPLDDPPLLPPDAEEDSTTDFVPFRVFYKNQIVRSMKDVPTAARRFVQDKKNATQGGDGLASYHDEYGESVLHSAVTFNFVAVVEYLLGDEVKLDPNVLDECGRTALYVAETEALAGAKHNEVIEMLKTYGGESRISDECKDDPAEKDLQSKVRQKKIFDQLDEFKTKSMTRARAASSESTRGRKVGNDEFGTGDAKREQVANDGKGHDNEDDDAESQPPQQRSDGQPMSLNVIPLPRLSGPDVSVEDFRAKHLKPPGGALPLHIRGLRGVDPSDWTRARMRELCGDAPLLEDEEDCEIDDEDDVRDEDCHSVKLMKRTTAQQEWGGLKTANLAKWHIETWGDLMDKQDATEQGGRLYLHDASIISMCPKMLDKLPGLPKYFPRDYDIFDNLDEQEEDLAKVELEDENFWEKFSSTLHFPSIFIGKGGSTGSRLHADTGLTRAFMLHLSGRKVWRLAAPKDHKRLYPSDPSALYGTEKSATFAVDLFDPNFEAHPLMDNLTVYEAVAEAGDVVFFPEGWPHQVRNLDDTVAVSVNFVDNGNLDTVAEFNRLDDGEDDYITRFAASYFAPLDDPPFPQDSDTDFIPFRTFVKNQADRSMQGVSSFARRVVDENNATQSSSEGGGGGEEPTIEGVTEHRDRYGRTLLHSATIYKFAAVVKYLLDKIGMDSNVLDDCGRTPLYVANSPHDEVAVLLQERGGVRNITQECERTVRENFFIGRWKKTQEEKEKKSKKQQEEKEEKSQKQQEEKEEKSQKQQEEKEETSKQQ